MTDEVNRPHRDASELDAVTSVTANDNTREIDMTFMSDISNAAARQAERIERDEVATQWAALMLDEGDNVFESFILDAEPVTFKSVVVLA